MRTLRLNLREAEQLQPKMKTDGKFWKVIIGLGAILFLLNSVAFIGLGQINDDEGWYLYASRLVFLGQYPYKDFAFTQTPLLPYIYGLPQSLLFQSIYLGRITSVIFSSAAFILLLWIANRYGGVSATGITSLFCATFTIGIYFQSITKTYALTTFLLALTFFVLSSSYQQNTKFILSTLFVLLAVLVRLSVIFFAIPLIGYFFAVSHARVRVFIITICVVTAFILLAFLLPNVAAAHWGLIVHHVAQWEGATLFERITRIFTARILNLWILFPQYFLFWVAILLDFKRIKTGIKKYPVILLIAAALGLFVIPNLVSGGFHVQYFVPLIFVSLPIAAIAYTKTASGRGLFSRTFLKAMLLCVILLGLLHGGYYHLDMSGTLPVEEGKQPSIIIAKNSADDDRIFALEALWLVVEADRTALQNMTMAQFSFYDTDTQTADLLHLVNGEIISTYITNRIPKMILLTAVDWAILRDTPQYETIVDSLARHYCLIYQQEDFGQSRSRLEIFVRCEDQ